MQCMNVCVYKYLSYKASSHNFKKIPNSNDYIPYIVSIIYHVYIVLSGTFRILYSTSFILSVIETTWFFIRIYKSISINREVCQHTALK